MNMNIMISINREYIGYACVMLMSLKQHHQGILLSVFILHNELTEEDFRQMDEVIGSEGIELIPVMIPVGATKEFQIGNWPEVCAYRLLATDLFAGVTERILHLDVDILITGDISEFYNTPFEGHYLIACEDWLPDDVRRQKVREMGREEDTRLFNSGVLLFNIEKMNQDGFCYAVYADIIAKYPAIRIEYPDQDMLNLLFCDKTRYMNRIRYNYVPYFVRLYEREHYYDTQEQLQQNCSIIHMACAFKSWENITRFAVDELWWAYAINTPFYTDMKKKHIQAMLHKHRKMSMMIDNALADFAQKSGCKEQLLQAETLLYDVLGHEIEITEEIVRAQKNC